MWISRAVHSRNHAPGRKADGFLTGPKSLRLKMRSRAVQMMEDAAFGMIRLRLMFNQRLGQ